MTNIQEKTEIQETSEQILSSVPVQYDLGNGNFLSVAKTIDTFWLSISEIATLYGVDRSVISKHIKEIFACGELDEKVECAFFAHTTQHGAIKGKTQTVTIKKYSLKVILHIGYRVNCKKGVHFRQWATSQLEEKITNKKQKNNNKIAEAEKLEKKERANKIRNLMKLKGISCTKIADDLGISTIMVSYLIHGRHFNIRFENWVEENLFQTQSGIENKINLLVKDVLKGDCESYNKLMLLFKSIANVYDFKSSKVDNWLKENLGV